LKSTPKQLAASGWTSKVDLELFNRSTQDFKVDSEAAGCLRMDFQVDPEAVGCLH
jgi:hypothetical protein